MPAGICASPRRHMCEIALMEEPVRPCFLVNCGRATRAGLRIVCRVESRLSSQESALHSSICDWFGGFASQG